NAAGCHSERATARMVSAEFEPWWNGVVRCRLGQRKKRHCPGGGLILARDSGKGIGIISVEDRAVLWSLIKLGRPHVFLADKNRITGAVCNGSEGRSTSPARHDGLWIGEGAG